MGSMIIVPVSGGWDSAITWLFVTGYLKDGCNQQWADPDAIAVFTDPGHEDPKTYHVLDTLDAMTNRPIIRLKGPTWEEALDAHSWFLPYHRARWCTRIFKIHPFEAFCNDKGPITSYIGLRADEQTRTGYLGDKGTQIQPSYPLQQMGITFADRERLAHEIGLPPPGLWSCFNCPFKQHYLWVVLVEQYPEQAEWCAWAEEEKERRGAGEYGWCPGFKIRELINNPQLRSNISKRYWAKHDHSSQLSLWDEDDEELTPCLMCQVK